jgi:hypothetical protein
MKWFLHLLSREQVSITPFHLSMIDVRSDWRLNSTSSLLLSNWSRATRFLRNHWAIDSIRRMKLEKHSMEDSRLCDSSLVLVVSTAALVAVVVFARLRHGETPCSRREARASRSWAHAGLSFFPFMLLRPFLRFQTDSLSLSAGPLSLFGCLPDGLRRRVGTEFRLTEWRRPTSTVCLERERKVRLASKIPLNQTSPE